MKPAADGTVVALAAAHTLLVALGGTDADAAHLAAAIRVYRDRRRSEGMGMPAAIRSAEETFAELAVSSSPMTTRGHALSVSAQSDEAVDDAVVGWYQMLTVAETAQRMRCSESTVRRREREGGLVACRHGRLVRFRADIVDAYNEGSALAC
jgi:excisionase family DNA binding protein